jgi:hypothetical protein
VVSLKLDAGAERNVICIRSSIAESGGFGTTVPKGFTGVVVASMLACDVMHLSGSDHRGNHARRLHTFNDIRDNIGYTLRVKEEFNLHVLSS